jgi:hypothetical protein
VERQIERVMRASAIRVLCAAGAAIVVAISAASVASPATADEKGIDRVVPKRNPVKTKPVVRINRRTGCHKGVPKSFEYYRKCALFGVPWLASVARFQRILGRSSSFSESIDTHHYNRSRGRPAFAIILTDNRRMFSMHLKNGVGLKITRRIFLGMKRNEVLRRLPGAKKLKFGRVLIQVGKTYVHILCSKHWQYQCRGIHMSTGSR